ncbi:hypothetical protein GCM10009416_02660 [Craurococcus roseus]|uniref:Uncharacterized protein n=1 Tax=Craurococcus roseus TaxID=77585 RepID=A0ABP3PPJ8_9PROT
MAGEAPAGLRHPQPPPAVLQSNEPVPGERREPRGGLGHHRQGHGAQVHGEVAHHALDQRAAGAVVLRQRAAARHRQPPGRDGGDVAALVGVVLDVTLGELADGRGAEAEQERRGVRGVALEVAAQRAGAGGLRHRVVGLGEVVEADGLVTGGAQRLLRGLRLFEAPERVGQGGPVDRALVGLHPWHMGVAEDRDPVGTLLGGEARAGRDMVGRLAGQAVHQIEVDPRDTGGAQPRHRIGHQFGRLDPADARLHLGRDVLRAEARAGEAALGEDLQHRVVDLARVELGRELGVRAQA